MLEVHTTMSRHPVLEIAFARAASDTGVIVPFDHDGSRSPVDVQNVLSKELPPIRRRPVRPRVLRYTARLLHPN